MDKKLWKRFTKKEEIIMEKINWTEIKFIARPDTWYIEGTEAKLVCCGEIKLSNKIEENWGLFKGMTNETFKGYTGELPRYDGETCPFEEFDIYYKNEIVNGVTYEKFISMAS